MATILTQSIPAELRDLYESALGLARTWKLQKNVRKRYPWRLPHMQGNGRYTRDFRKGWDFSNAQFLHRAVFGKSCDCFNVQNPSHAVIDPPAGPKSHGYWYSEATGSGLWYYNYFMQQTINSLLTNSRLDYCEVKPTAMNDVGSAYPDTVIEEPTSINLNYFNNQDTWAYIRQTNPRVTWLHIFLTYVNWDERYVYGLTLQIHETNGSWDPTTLTWNNKPPKGKLIYEFYFTGALAQWDSLWVHFPIKGEKNYILSVKPPPGPMPEWHEFLFETVWDLTYPTYQT